MTGKVGMGLGAACAILALPVGAGLADDKQPASAELSDKLQFSSEAAILNTYNDPAGAPTNPGNLVKNIERNAFKAELRNRIEYNDRVSGVTLRIDPWLRYENVRFGAGRAPTRTREDVDLLINGYLARARGVIPRTTVSFSRQSIEWAPGYLASPSNPFTTRNTTENPISRDPGSDFVTVSVSPTWDTTLTAYANYNKGEDNGLTPFRRTYALVGSYYSDDYAISVLYAHSEDRGGLVGSYGQWTADEALLLYYDAGIRRGSKQLYPVRETAFPTGGFYAATESDSGKLFPEVLVGASYTTKTGYSLYAEYLYYGPGYNDRQRRLANSLNATAAGLFDSQPDAAMATLGGAAETGLLFPGRHFLNLQLLRRSGPWDFVVQNANNLQDLSGRLFGSVAYSWGANKLAVSGIMFYGKRGGVMRQDLDARITIGLSRRF